VDLLALAAEECARYEDCHLDGEPAQVRGDPRLLRRLVRNLLENAKRHGAPPIEVTVRRIHQNGSAAVELSVRDHGVGVPDSEQEKIFDPFYRMAGATSTGTGLGLSLVRQIARKHGGEAQCDRPASGGTRITVTLASADHVP
jgi:signal transduction histidine kinase